MAYSQKQKNAAREHYVKGKKIHVIAKIMDIPASTVQRWKRAALDRGDDWDLARTASLASGDGFDEFINEAVNSFAISCKIALNQVESDETLPVQKRIELNNSIADSFSKMMKAAGRASPRLSAYAIASDVLSRLSNFVQQEFPQHAGAFLEIIQPFGESLAKEYSDEKQ